MDLFLILFIIVIYFPYWDQLSFPDYLGNIILLSILVLLHSLNQLIMLDILQTMVLYIFTNTQYNPFTIHGYIKHFNSFYFLVSIVIRDSLYPHECITIINHFQCLVKLSIITYSFA